MQDEHKSFEYIMKREIQNIINSNRMRYFVI